MLHVHTGPVSRHVVCAAVALACAEPRLRPPGLAIPHFFSALSTHAVDNFVCQTMRDSCPGVWAANELTTIGECEAKLAALPLADGEELYYYVDGNTCASLYASLHA